MRRKRFPGEYHGRAYLDQPNPELSKYLQKCAKQNTVERPSQLNYDDPWADWTKYPLVAWPQPQSAKEASGLHQNSGFPAQKQPVFSGGYPINPYGNQERMYIEKGAEERKEDRLFQKKEAIDYTPQAQTEKMETPDNRQGANAHSPVEPVGFASPQPESSGNTESPEAEANLSQEENSIIEDAAYEESDPGEKAQSPEEMMEEKRGEKEAEKFEPTEQEQTSVEGRQTGVKGNNVLVWRDFPQ